MAINKRGSRRIVIGASAYRWTIRPKPSDCQGNAWTALTFAVELESARGSVLLVEMDCSRPDNWTHLNQANPVVTPKLVAGAIQAAIAQGWQPKLSGKPHVLHVGADKQFLAGRASHSERAWAH